MCRFVVYRGPALFLSDLLTRSERSLIRQSYEAQERREPLNGDGFGVGWYAPEVAPEPCVFTSVSPAWSNRNLGRLAEKTRSTCLFAHVRAATKGLLVSEVNCHPFQHGRFLWMHNGHIAEFRRVKRRLRESLGDETYDLIQGTTDSEHAFALFLDGLEGRDGDVGAEGLGDRMVATIRTLERWGREAGIDAPSFLNFAVTDGRSVVASRYVGCDHPEPATLYYSSGARFESRNGGYRMVPSPAAAAAGPHGAVIVASEPLTEERSDWRPVPRNHLVTVTPDLEVRLRAIG